MNSFRPLFFIPLIILIAGIHGHAEEAVRITSDIGMDSRVLVAVPNFAVSDAQFVSIAAEMTQAVSDDLEFSGLFVALPPARYPAGFTGIEASVSAIDLPAWRATRAENLVHGYIYQDGDSLVAQFRLFDLYSNTQLYGQEIRVDRSHYRLAAHRFTEEVVRVVDGVPGIGTSEIVFAGISGPGVKEIYVADYDGANVRRLTNHNSLSIMPEISPNGSDIVYLSYKDRYSFLYVLNRATGATHPLSKEVGLNSAAMWAPDNERLAMTLSKDGNAEIYLRNKNGSNTLRLTNNRDGDTSPCFSPDGGRIAFVSDRAGRPQIYVMNADGSNQNRLSFHGGSAYDPIWSPDGKMIAFVSSISGEGLEIYVMGADGSNPQRLTNSPGINEAPCWSPDSRHIAFTSSRRGRPELWAITLSTMTEKAISRVEMPAEGPSWGPRRK